MSGYYADIADVGKEVYSREASSFAYDYSLNRIKSEVAEFRKYTITGDTPAEGTEGPGTAFSSRAMKGHSAMFPVWFMSYRNGDRVTYASVNGQTGKVAADLPIDPKKYLLFSGILAAVIFVILNLFLVLTPKVVLILATILTVMVFVINGTQRSAIKRAETGEDDKGLQYKNNKDNKEAKSKKKIKPDMSGMETIEKIITIAGVISIVIGLVMFFTDLVVRDTPYYVLCIIDAAVFMVCFRYTLKNYNRVATRKLPQFNREGGDDRA